MKVTQVNKKYSTWKINDPAYPFLPNTNMFMSLKETAHQQEAVTHPKTFFSLNIIYTMATIGSEQDLRSVLEYVDLSTYVPTPLHSK